jgi:phosphatidylinositol phospholipase C beta
MAGARPGVHVVRLKAIHVSESLIAGNKFIKWDEDSNICVPVTLRVDSNGYFLYWQDQNKEVDSLDVAFIRDTRTGKHARLPKDPRLREMVTMGSTDCPLEDKMLTIAYGIDMVNISYISFAATSKEAAKEWSMELFQYATNLLALNASPLNYLDKYCTKLSLFTDVDSRIPIKSIVKTFAQNKDDRKRVKQAIEAAKLIPDKNDGLEKLTPDEFFLFYHRLCGRQEVTRVFNQIGGEKKSYLTAEQFMTFLNCEQRDPRLNEILYPYYDVKKSQQLIDQFERRSSTSAGSSAGQGLTAEGFLRYLLSNENAIVPPEKLDLNEDMSQPLAHYFINSSHNTYLTGHQLTGKSSVEIYRQVLLSGCRCVELDCWDGKGADEEPIITHGFTMCSDIVLKEVLEAIAETAFKVSDYPVILSFENHCSPRQQVKIAMHCRNIFGDSLLTEPLEAFPLAPDVPLPSPELLRRKILIKNKKVHAPHSADTTDPCPDDVDSDTDLPGYVEDIVEFGDSDDAKRQSAVDDIKGGAVEEAEANMEMSSLVNYIQPARFHSFDFAEKRSRSYECTSFVETQATALLKEFPVEFVNFNKRQISRIYPKGTRVDSSNYMPQIFWNAGCQLVALNFQTLDLAMQLNLGTFEYNGRSGFILKPDFMRRKDRQFDPFAESTVDGIVAGTVHVKIISGQFLTDRKIGTYVEVDMFGLPADTVRRKFRTKVIPGNGINPVYDEEPFVFRKVVLPNLAILRIAVYSENGTSLLGHRILPVEGLRPGYRHISLRNECNQPQGIATLFVHIRVTDYIPDAFADFAAALANPIAYQSRLEKHSQQLAILEDIDSEDGDGSSPNGNETSAASAAPGWTDGHALPGARSASGTASSSQQLSSSSATAAVNRRIVETVCQQQQQSLAVKRVGSVTNRGLSNQESTGCPSGSSSYTSAALSEASAASQSLMKSSSVPNSPHHGGVSTATDPSSVKSASAAAAQKMAVTSQSSKLNDPDVLEPISLELLRENKQYAKLAAKFEREMEILRRKHEKLQTTKMQQHQSEEERLISEQTRNRSALERSNLKSSRRRNATDVLTGDVQQQMASLVDRQQQELTALKTRHHDELSTLCGDLYRAELDLQLGQLSALRSRLEQLLVAARDARLAKLNRLHDAEVNELKKKLDAHNWDEMKALAKRHRDKNELARVRREATQKHITLAVQERQKLRDVLEQRNAEVRLHHEQLLSQLSLENKLEEDRLQKQCDEKCHSAVAGDVGSPAGSQCSKSVQVQASDFQPPPTAATAASTDTPHRANGDDRSLTSLEGSTGCRSPTIAVNLICDDRTTTVDSGGAPGDGCLATTGDARH